MTPTTKITTKSNDSHIEVTVVFRISQADLMTPLERLFEKVISKSLPKVEPIEQEFSPKEAAALKGTSVKTIRRRIESGELKSYQLGKGGRIIIKKSDLDALVIRRNLNDINF